METLGQDRNFPLLVKGYNHFLVQNADQIGIHCAFDRHMDRQICWWKLAEVSELFPEVPTRTLSVGVIPGVANTVFVPNPDSCSERSKSIAQVTFYTRIFHQLHMDDWQYVPLNTDCSVKVSFSHSKRVKLFQVI